MFEVDLIRVFWEDKESEGNEEVVDDEESEGEELPLGVCGVA